MASSKELLDQQLVEEAQLAEADLPKFRDLWDKELQKKIPNADTKFQYAMLLTKSARSRDNRAGIVLLEELARTNYHPDECYYHIALAQYKLGEYNDSRRSCEMVLRIYPDQRAAQRLHNCLLESINKRDTMVGGVAAAGVALAGLALGLMLSKRR